MVNKIRFFNYRNVMLKINNMFCKFLVNLFAKKGFFSKGFLFSNKILVGNLKYLGFRQIATLIQTKKSLF